MMGYGMAMLVDSRMRRGWSVLRIMKHFLIRGLVLMLTERVDNVVMQLTRAPAAGKFPSVAHLFIGSQMPMLCGFGEFVAFCTYLNTLHHRMDHTVHDLLEKSLNMNCAVHFDLGYRSHMA